MNRAPFLLVHFELILKSAESCLQYDPTTIKPPMFFFSEKAGGKVLVRANVEEIIIRNGKVRDFIINMY